jgi:hypothetical protein
MLSIQSPLRPSQRLPGQARVRSTLSRIASPPGPTCQWKLQPSRPGSQYQLAGLATWFRRRFSRVLAIRQGHTPDRNCIRSPESLYGDDVVNGPGCVDFNFIFVRNCRDHAQHHIVRHAALRTFQLAGLDVGYQFFTTGSGFCANRTAFSQLVLRSSFWCQSRTSFRSRAACSGVCSCNSFRNSRTMADVVWYRALSCGVLISSLVPQTWANLRTLLAVRQALRLRVVQ